MACQPRLGSCGDTGADPHASLRHPLCARTVRPVPAAREKKSHAMNLPLGTYNGLEVDMLSVGNADSILVTRWTNGLATRVLLDGGNKGSASTVKAFLLSRRIQYFDHIVCTHPHDDHAAGLIELVTDKRFDFG